MRIKKGSNLKMYRNAYVESCTNSSTHEQTHSYILYAYFTFFPFSPTQFNHTAESSTKMKRSFYAAKDLYKYRHSYPVKCSPTLFAVFPSHSTVLRNGCSFNGFLLFLSAIFFHIL